MWVGGGLVGQNPRIAPLPRAVSQSNSRGPTPCAPCAALPPPPPVVAPAHARPQDSQRRISRRHSLDCTAASKTAQFPFRPTITREAQNARPRSVEELCYSDYLQRQASVAKGEAEVRAREMRDCTFSPRVNADARASHRRALFSENPELLGLWVRAQEQCRAARQQAALDAQFRKETEECTFQPEIHGLPAYMQDIASSMGLIRPKRATPKKCDHTFGYSI